MTLNLTDIERLQALRYQSIERIPSDSFITYKATRGGVPVCIQLFPHSQYNNQNGINPFKAHFEAIIPECYASPNLVQVVEAFNTPTAVCLVTVFCGGTGGNVQTLMLRLNRVPYNRDREEKVKTMFKRIFTGVQYLHSRNIAHRRLSMETVLVKEERNMEPLVGNLNYLRKVASPDTFSSVNNAFYSGANRPDDYHHYMPPEFVSAGDLEGTNVRYDPYKLDTWCLGVMLFFSLNRQYPYPGPKPSTPGEMACLRNKQSNPEINLSFREDFHVTENYKKLVKQMLAPNPASRPTIEKVLDHAWFQ